MHDHVGESVHLTVPEQANLLAAQAVAAATSYLDGRCTPTHLAREAARVFIGLEQLGPDPRSSPICDITRLLVTAMMRAVVSEGPRAERWADVMTVLVPLLRLESTELAAIGAQRQ